MRNPKISKRALGLTMVAALAVSATTFAVTGTAVAATAAATVSPKTGGPTAGAVLAITGKAFKAGSTTKALSVTFETTACSTTVGSAPGTVLSVISETYLTVLTPTLTGSTTGTKYFVCVNDAASGTTKVLGQGTYTVYPAPTLTKLNGTAVTGAVVAKDSTFGGNTVTVEGTNFTKAAKINIAGTAITTKFVDSTTLTGVLAAHTPGTAFQVSVVDVGGIAKAATPANASVTYVNAITVTPDTGNGAAVQPIKVTGSGFNSLTFVSTLAASSTLVLFVPPVVGTLAKGSYSVNVITTSAAGTPFATDITKTTNTDFSSKAIYTVSDF